MQESRFCVTLLHLSSWAAVTLNLRPDPRKSKGSFWADGFSDILWMRHLLLQFSTLLLFCPYTLGFSSAAKQRFMMQLSCDEEAQLFSTTPTIDAATDMKRLVDRAVATLEKKRKENKNAQVFIGVGGAPGSGKVRTYSPASASI